MQPRAKMFLSLNAAALNLAIFPLSASCVATIVVSAQCNIYGAGHAVAPNPGGNGGGLLPVKITLPPGTSAVRISDAGGTVLFCPSCGPASGPDGTASGFSMSSYGGISGIASSARSRFLAAVFLDDSAPADPAPAILTFDSYSFASLSPLLRQTFFVGDGMTGTGTGTTQVFIPPAGTTRVYFGLFDSIATLPGWYDDNSGAFTLTVNITTCPGDLNLDGFVNDSDFVVFVEAYNLLVCDLAMPTGCPADLNDDDVVDDADFVLFVSAYNTLLCP